MKLPISWKESDYSLSIITPYPFLREVELNFAVGRGKLQIIATGDWTEDLRMVSMVYIGDESFIAERIDSEYVLGLFKKKYGQEHMDRYFGGPIEAFSLTPGIISYEPEVVIANVFDASMRNYEKAISEDSTQRYMRAISGEALEKYYFPGAEILDLGAGVMYETRKYISRSRLSAVEGSPFLQENIRKQFTMKELENLEIYASLKDVQLSGRRYDIIFSTFGYLELNRLDETLEVIVELLKPHGIFIAGFWNSKGILDNLFSLIQGNFKYVTGKRRGIVPAGQGRYSLASFTHKISDFTNLDALTVKDIWGICNIMPPYNYGFSQKLSGRAIFRLFDRFIGRIPFLLAYSEFIIMVLRKS